jgi:hypothetical protein
MISTDQLTAGLLGAAVVGAWLQSRERTRISFYTVIDRLDGQRAARSLVRKELGPLRESTPNPEQLIVDAIQLSEKTGGDLQQGGRLGMSRI